jgi:carbon starvation protein CstA
LNIFAHIKNKTFDYENVLGPLQNLAAYMLVILIFASLVFVSSTILPSDTPSVVTQMFNFNIALYMTTMLIIVGYSRKILESLMVFGCNVAKFLPFLGESQKIVRKRYNIDTDRLSMSSDEKKKNIW